MIISRTPFRISFFGGGTDYPAWYRAYGGSVLATTINKYCYISCRYLPPFFDHRIRVVYSKIENCQYAGEIDHPAVREVLRYLKIDRGVEIHHDGDLPARSGMGSSSAFTVGLLHALHALTGHIPTVQQLAAESIYVEQELLKEAVGCQDQVLAAHGGFNHIVFDQSGDISVRPMTLPSERISELNSHLMLFFTGVSRTASEIAQSYVQDLESKEREMRAMRDMVQEGISILNGTEDLQGFGALLHEGWLLKRSLSAKISNDYVEQLYQEARSAGAIGGKLLGAGGGGFMLFFVRPQDQERVRGKLRQLIYVPFRFEFSGSRIIFFDLEEDYSKDEKVRANEHAMASREFVREIT
jgi:D-glycero-alpha-D-manno-heptose-7-phosphate kinase